MISFVLKDPGEPALEFHLERFSIAVLAFNYKTKNNWSEMLGKYPSLFGPMPKTPDSGASA